MSLLPESPSSLRVVQPHIAPETKHSTTHAAARGLAQYSARRFSQGFQLLAKRSHPPSSPETPEDGAFLELEEESLGHGDAPAGGASAGNGISIDGPDAILAAHWDALPNNRHVLTLVFRDGVQLWDAHKLATLQELCFIPAPPGLDLVSARLLQPPSELDAYSQKPRSSAWKHAPLLALACTSQRNNAPVATLYIHSLDLDRPVKEVTVKGHLVQFLSNQHFIVLSCISPPALHVLSNSSFSVDPISPILDLAIHPHTGHPLVDLGNSRLLSYASNTSVAASAGSGVVPQFGWEHRENTRGDSTPPTDFARKFSQGALTGMRAIGDFGSSYWTASRSPPPAPRVSKSAPSAAATFGRDTPPQKTTNTPSTVKVVDLKLYRAVAHFSPSHNQHAPISLLSLSPTGALVLVSTEHAHEFHIFQLRPLSALTPNEAVARAGVPAVWHRYRLPRGVTPADARRADWSVDAKFVSVYTSHGTTHVYGIRPIGGAPSYPSHLHGGIANSHTFEPLSVSIQQSARLRSSQNAAFPARLAAPTTVQFDVSSARLDDFMHEAPTPVKDACRLESRAATQSLLVFSPHDGALVLASLSASMDSAATLTSGASSGLSSMLQRHANTSGLTASSISLQLDRKAIWPLTGPRQKKPYVSATLAAAPPLTSAVRFDDSRRWTAQAEVRTFNLHKNVLPRSIYLSHAFIFYMFSRKFSWTTGSLRPPSRRVAVRKEVQFLSTDGKGGVSPSAEGISEPIRLAMKAQLSIEARSASPGSPSYLAPIALNGVPGKSGGNQSWPMKAVAPHLEYVQGGWKQMRSELNRLHGKGLQETDSEQAESSSLSFEDKHSTHLLDDSFGIPSSEEDMPSLAQDSGSTSTRHTSEDAWSHWEHGSRSESPQQPSPASGTLTHQPGDAPGRQHDIEPFVLDEDFAIHESENHLHLDVPGVEVTHPIMNTPPLISLGSSPATPSVPTPLSIDPNANNEKEQDPPPPPTASIRKAGRKKKR